MARHKAILQSEFPYHVSARCINKEWFQLPMEEVWTIMSEELFLSHHYFGLQIHAYVLMINHFHLIASTPDANISEVMLYFMTNTSRRLTERANRINQTYGGRHFKCVLQSTIYFFNAYKYVYRNPVEAKVCALAEDYPFSTLAGLLGRQHLLIPVVEDSNLFTAQQATLQWINTPPEPQKLEAMRWGLRRKYFASMKSRTSGKPILGIDDAL